MDLETLGNNILWTNKKKIILCSEPNSVNVSDIKPTWR